MTQLAEEPAENRARVMHELGMTLEPLGGLPVERAFLNWDEVREMSEAGITFAPFGHRHCPFNEMTEKEIAADLHQAALIFNEQQIRPLPVVAFPEGAITKDARAILKKLGVHFGIADAPHPPPSTSQKTAAVLGRTSIFESVSYGTDLFACRLWNISSWGVTF